MNKPVLVLVMSQKCGACHNFKAKMLPELEKDLKNDNRFRFLVLDLPDMGVPKTGRDIAGNEFHPDLKNGFVQFFPTFLLFPGNLWNDKNSRLKGVPKHDMEKNPKVDYSRASILSWIDSTIETDPLFSNSFPKTNKKEYVVPTYGTYNRFKGTKTDSL